MTAAFTVRLEDDVAEALDLLAGKMDRSRSYVAAQAIAHYVTEQSWQIAQIQEGLDAANAGDFASDDEVNAVFAKSGLAPISWK